MIKVRKAKKECTEAIHTGKIFNNVEIKVYLFNKV